MAELRYSISTGPVAAVADCNITPHRRQTFERFVVGFTIQTQSRIRMPQAQRISSIDFAAHPFATNVRRCPGDPADGFIPESGESSPLHRSADSSPPLERFVRRLDTNGQDQMLPEAPFHNRKLNLQLTGIPRQSFRGFRSRGNAGCRGRKQSTRRHLRAREYEKRATIHEFIRVLGSLRSQDRLSLRAAA
jgi:hypothetical protein